MQDTKDKYKYRRKKKYKKISNSSIKNSKNQNWKLYLLPCMLFVFDTSQLETSLLKTDACWNAVQPFETKETEGQATTGYTREKRKVILRKIN